jgi:putative ABC transport system permease protein
VSLAGGVLDTRGLSDAAVADLRAALADLPGVVVAAEKAAVLDDAERDGATFTELFATIGAFSVLAGLLLLVNLFVMLAEERKTELGMLRALGFTRRRLIRAFALEGAIYALAAAALGAVVGVGIGWLVAVLAGAIGIADGGAGYPLVIEPVSLAIGGTTGLVISLLTIWATSLRIARLNVIRAIRDLPEPRVAKARTRTQVLASAGLLVGAALGVAGYLNDNGIALLLGVPIAAFSATPLLRRVLPERSARLLVAGTVLAWGLAALPLFREIVGAADATVFVVQGVVLTAGAVSLAAGLDWVWAFTIGHLGRGTRGLAPRLGIAYPLARRFRTSMLLGMFSLVIFTVTLIAAMSASFDRNTDATVAEAAAGFDVLVDANPANPIDAEALAARGDVAAVAGLARAVVNFEAEHIDGTRAWAITGFDADLLQRQAPALMQRADGYASDAETYRAVLDDPTLAIVPDLFLVGAAGVAELAVGDSFAVIEPRSGEPRKLTIAGVYLDWLGNGALVSRELTAALLGAENIVSRSYVAAADGADANAVAADLDATFLAHGADANTFTPLVTEALSQQRGFMALAQGFLGLGLLVGIAGLGVVMVRAVRERRQEIGMLRAIGFRTGLVRAALLSEAGLIAVQGTIIGAALGLVTTHQLLTGSQSFGDGQMPFAVPWGGLIVILALPLAASLAATAWPASRAAATPPAVALRTAA